MERRTVKSATDAFLKRLTPGLKQPTQMGHRLLLYMQAAQIGLWVVCSCLSKLRKTALITTMTNWMEKFLKCGLAGILLNILQNSLSLTMRNITAFSRAVEQTDIQS